MDKSFIRKMKGARDMQRGIRFGIGKGTGGDAVGKAGWRGLPC